MNAPPALLPPHVVSLLLSYLPDPLPAHLLSAPLRQRHHFLGLGQVLDTAQDVATYLSWPSGSEHDLQRIAELLDALPSAENFDPLTEYPTKYSFDGETVYAHAQVPLNSDNKGDSAGLRLVFRWETIDDDGVVLGHGIQGVSTNADNWKYHDAGLMPFPLGTYDSPEEALLPASTSTAKGITPTPAHPPSSIQPSARSVPPVAVNSDSDDDAYWDSYGRSNSDDEDESYASRYSRNTVIKGSDDEKAEEAYWSQYSSVHGTADSTRHSPLPQKRRLHDPSQPVPFNASLDYSSYFDRLRGHEFLTSEPRGEPTTYDPYDNNENIRYLHRFSAAGGRETSPDGVPLPEAISRRLHNLSPRPDINPSPAPPEVGVGAIKDEELQLENMDSPDAVSSDTSDEHTLTPPGNTETSAIPELSLSASTPPSATNDLDGREDLGLHEAIRGIYRLWAATRQRDTSAQKDEFLDIVRDALKTA